MNMLLLGSLMTRSPLYLQFQRLWSSWRTWKSNSAAARNHSLPSEWRLPGTLSCKANWKRADWSWVHLFIDCDCFSIQRIYIYIYTLGAGGSPGTPAPKVFIYIYIWSYYMVDATQVMGWGWVGVGWGGDDNVPCSCTHGRCSASNGMGWGGVGMITFLAVAHMVGATQHHVPCTCTQKTCLYIYICIFIYAYIYICTINGFLLPKIQHWW